MIRIVFFDGSLKQGGAERVISVLSKYLVKKEYIVEIILYYDREQFYEIHPDVKVISIEKETHSKNVFQNLRWMRRYFRRNADIIISFLAPFNILALLAHFGLKTRIIVADRNDPRYVPGNRLVRILRDFLYRFSDGVVCQTDNNLRYFSNSIRKKGTVIFNPVDLGDKRGQALRTPKEEKIVSVGRLIKQKNQMLAINAFRMVSGEFPALKLVFYGDGDMEDELRRYVKSLSLEERILFPGSSKSVFDDESDAKLFVLTSDYEGMPNALLEAMCLGIPVISTRVSGAEDLIRSGTNGFLLDSRKPEELADKLRTLLTDDTLRAAIGREAVRLNDDLAVASIMEQWDAFIQSCM